MPNLSYRGLDALNVRHYIMSLDPPLHYLQYPDIERESFEGDGASTCSLSLRLGLVYLLVIMSLEYKAGSTRSLWKLLSSFAL